MSNVADLYQVIKAARGHACSDLLFKNARIINVFSGEVQFGSIAVKSGYIVGIGDYEALEQIDLKGRYLSPGFIDSHVHIESSMTCVSEFARVLASRGTTTVAADPHEIANVLGAAGIRFMLESAKEQPINVCFTLPSCVPATDFETSGAALTAEDIETFMDHEKILGLGEMMNFPGVLLGTPSILAKIQAARRFKKCVDGHAPGLSGLDLQAYLAAGISSDHECTSASEAREKLSSGMHIMIREGTAARNLKELAPLVNSRTAPRIMWCTDDRHPHELINEGSIDSIVRKAISAGVDPITAIRIGTLSAADYFGLKDTGAVAPGRRADLIVFEELEKPSAEMVFKDGVLVSENGEIIPETPIPKKIDLQNSMMVDLSSLDFSIPAEGKRARAIEIVPDQIVTRQIFFNPLIKDGFASSDVENDILKVAVVERHKRSGKVSKAFLKGLGLKRGAIASSVAHDSHNIITAGVDEKAMAAAVREVVRMEGGLALAIEDSIIARLELPVAGLMSNQSVKTVHQQLDRLILAVRELGAIPKDPFMTLSFLALPVIPELKLTDQGLVDVNRFEFVPLFIS